MIESSQPTTSEPSSQPKRRTTKKHKQHASQHYDALLRQLQVSGSGWIGEAPCALGVTSCHPREGVTTVAVNLALAAADALRRPILLVDANARRPSLHKIFRVPMTDGLIGAASGDSTVFDCIVPSRIENLSVLPSGESPADREPVYESTALEELLDNLKHVFPLIVFDLPPATDMTTCFALAAKVDGVVLVIEAGRVDRAIAERAKCRLAETNANLVGVVFNKR